ncbi:MAG: glycosyltransferase [Chloroflexi bacterium]|nr:glycosyltransferase [Chloroflexota bacterium]
MPEEPLPAFSSTPLTAAAEAASETVQLSVVVPAYNEAGRIAESLTAICRYLDQRGQCYEVIPVNDGSTDGSAAEIDAAALRLNRPNGRVHPLHLEVNQGKGAAVRAGILRARGAIVMYLDTDLSIPISIAGEFAAGISAGADIAIASRYLPGSDAGSVRPVRRLLSAGYRQLAALILSIGFSDIQCGAKAFRREVALQLFQQQRITGFSFDAEVLYLAAQAGCRVAEVPFTLRISKYSSIRLVFASATMFKDLFRIRFNALRGIYSLNTDAGKVRARGGGAI